MLIAGICLLVLAVILVVVHVFARKRIAALLVAKPLSTQEILHDAEVMARELNDGTGYKEMATIEGRAVCQSPLTSPIAQVPCLHYEATVTREYEEDYEERDQNGHIHRRTRRCSEVISSQKESCDFTIDDGQGQIEVINRDATFDHLEQSADRFEPQSSATGNGLLMQFGLGMLEPRHGRRTLGYRYSESVLPLSRLTVVGQASHQMGRLSIGAGGMAFILSTRPRTEMLSSAKSSANATSIASLVAAIAGVVVTIFSFVVG